MRLKFTVISCLFLLFFVLACTDAPDQTTDTPSTPPTPSTSVDEVYLRSITVEEMETLWMQTNQIDYIFYDLPISSSVDNSPSAQVHLRHISDTPVNQTTKAKCTKGIGRAFYKSDGVDLMEAEIFFSQQCAFLIFYKNGVATAGNLMTQDGVNFYTQMINAAQGAQPNFNG